MDKVYASSLRYSDDAIERSGKSYDYYGSHFHICGKCRINVTSGLESWCPDCVNRPGWAERGERPTPNRMDRSDLLEADRDIETSAECNNCGEVFRYIQQYQRPRLYCQVKCRDAFNRNKLKTRATN